MSSNVISSKHTAGPWSTSPDGVPDAWKPQITVYADADGGRVATVFREEANAHLIAAAPDMLAALGALLEVMNRDKDGDVFICKEADHVIEAACAAFNKAKGNA